jgi:aryl-alcohol dehydrogenase-like predicted oxidoreductase
MRYKLLGTSGLRVSELALGTLTFGEPKGWGTPPDVARNILEAYAARGGLFLDTAPNYAGGAAEAIVGDFLGAERERFVVATKYTASNDHHVLAGGNSARTMIRSVEESLKRLKTDFIDVLWLHYWDGTTPLVEILKASEALIASGKIRYFGFSDTPAWIVSRAVTLAELRGWSLPVAIQLEYSLAARDGERELLPMARALGLGAVCWGPLAAGALAGGPDPQRRRAEALPATLRAVAGTVAQISARAGHAPVDLALRWLLRRPDSGNAIALLGARTPDQLNRCLDATEGDLGEDLIAALDAATATDLGFPHNLIASSYLRKLALGDPAAVSAPLRPRS